MNNSTFSEKLNILVCYAKIYSNIGAIQDYVNSFKSYSKHNIYYFDPFEQCNNSISLESFDAIIIIYCTIGQMPTIPKDFFAALANFSKTKIAIIQDEYDNALRYHQQIASLNINCIVTTIPNPKDYYKVYYGPELAHLDFIYALTGYVTEDMLSCPAPKPFASRDWKIGYRGRILHFKYGRLAWDKYYIGVKMKEICDRRSIPTNIELDEGSRIYGYQWIEFIRNCRVNLGTESASNVFDFDGSVKAAIDNYMEKKPDVDFETVYDLFLKKIEGKIEMNMISPRIFEAIAYGTGLVLFEGNYSGVIEPWKHYIPLKKDFSNVDEVLEAVDNIPLLEKMTSQAYNDIILSGKYSYATLIYKIDDYISQRVVNPQMLEPIFMLVGWRDKCMNVSLTQGYTLNEPTEKILLASDHLGFDNTVDITLFMSIKNRLRRFKKSYSVAKKIYRFIRPAK